MAAKLSPTPEEIEAMRKQAPHGPITVVNLLKMRDGADAPIAYRRYLADTAHAHAPNCEVIHARPAFHDFGAGEAWDYVIIARYDRFEDFAVTVASGAWQHSARHRPEALETTITPVTSAGDLASDFGA